MNDLSTASLLANASARCGLADFGGSHFMEALDKFVHACLTDGYVTEAGIGAVAEALTNVLVNRLRFEEDLRKHPEVLDQELVTPLVIIGAGRVGSTKMHRLMSRAGHIQTLPFWQVKNPGRVQGLDADGSDPRIAPVKAQCRQIERGMPQLFAAIEPIAEEPDEDAHLLDLTFMQFYFCALAYAPSYIDWLFKQDWRESYRYLERLLKYLQWQNRTSGKPLLLKSPFHTAYIDLVHDVLPGAKFIQIHRDPVTCAASLGKVACLWQHLSGGKGTLREYGALLENYITQAFLENLRIREARPEIPIADFYYEDVCNDAVGLAAKMFEFWGFPLSAQDMVQLHAYEDANIQHQYGKFVYSLEEMGIDRARMERRLAPYMQRFYSGST
jgi:hypothetical protein